MKPGYLSSLVSSSEVVVSGRIMIVMSVGSDTGSAGSWMPAVPLSVTKV